MNNNKLVSLPEEIGKMQTLMELDASCNEITHLPVQIGDLAALKVLNLRRNHLQEIPIGDTSLLIRRASADIFQFSKEIMAKRRKEMEELGKIGWSLKRDFSIKSRLFPNAKNSLFIFFSSLFLTVASLFLNIHEK